MPREIDQIIEVITRRDAEIAERLVELDGMRAILHPSLPDVWDLNALELTRPGIPVEDVVAAADATIGDAGMRHRTIYTYDREDGERLAAALLPQGWKIERNVYMALNREPDRAADPAIEVEEIGLDEVEEARRGDLAIMLTDYFDEVTDAIVDQFIAFDRIYSRVCGDRWFVVRHEGKVVNHCRLLESFGTAQVEDVVTFPDYRKRGMARASILAAIEAGRAAGHELIFIGADDEDWPKDLYRKLGFDPVGPETALYRKPGTGA